MPLPDVSIAITSFCRWGYLSACLAGIRANLPECKILVADDSFDNRCADIAGPECIRLSPDSGLTSKRNATVKACQTKYILLGSDDFDFSTPEAREGIEKLVRTMDEYPEIDVAGGRVDHREYEGYLEYVPGKYIREHRMETPIDESYVPAYIPVDLTVNYFLARTESIRAFPWPEEMKIGGEHVCFFLDLKMAGKKVVWIPGVNVNTLHLGMGSDVQDPLYSSFRRRAVSLGHPLMKKRYNISTYIGFDGGIS